MFTTLISQEKNKIRNSELLVAAATKKLKLVKKLVQEGADVNYVGSGGNTSLHCAAKDGSIGIARYLLSKGADVYVENVDRKTPFDLVYNEETKKEKRIKAELQKSIIEKAYSVIENHVNEKESIQLEDVGEEESEVNSGVMITNFFHLKKYYSDKNFIFLSAQSLNLVGKKIEKIKSFDRYLRSLLVEGKIPPSNTKFTYEQANIFIFFLEAVAFQDIELSSEAKMKLRKEFEEKKMEINNGSEKEIQKEINKRKTEIANGIKYYFTLLYYPPNFEEDLKLVNVARNLLCHSSDKKITLDDVGKLICPGTTTRELFTKIYEYVSYICDKFDEPQGPEGTELALASVLLKINKQDNLDIGTQGEIILEEELAKLIMETYDQEEWTRERTQEILFSFLVNISPAFGKEMSGLSTLRNKIIHEFHKYKDVDSIIKMEFEKTVYDLRSKLFKYYYAKVVHKILHEIKPSEDSEDIKKNLRSALKEFEEKFGKQFKIASQEDADGSFEYSFYLTSKIMTTSVSNEDMSQNIIQYVKFMTMVEDDKIKYGKENPQHFNDIVLENQCDEIQQNSDDDEDESENFAELIEKNYPKILNFVELNIFNRREIFDNFLKLSKLKICLSKSRYLQEKRVFRSELTKNYGVNERYFDAVCKKYIEGDDELPRENLIYVNKIINIINILRRFQSDYVLSIRDVILLYTRVVEGKGIYDLESNLNLLKNQKVSKSKVEKFQKDISSLHKDNVINVTLFDKQKVQLNAVKIVCNILMMFCNTYYSYQINFNNIEEAFKDKEFLDYMIELEKVYQKSCTDKNKNFEFRYYKFMILKKLLKIKYTAPYIVRSIIEDENENIMEKEDMITLMQSLLDNNDYIDHVSELLKVSCEGVDLYQSVCEKLLKSNVNEMRQIFEEPIHVKHILQSLNGLNTDDETKSKFENEIIKLLNDIVYHLYCEGNYDNALELLDIYLAKQSAEACSLEILGAKRLEARIRNRKGQSLNRKSRRRDNCEALQEYKNALDILLNIKKVLEQNKKEFFDIKYTSLYLLTLSHIANTYHLLGDHVHTVKELGKLYNAIKCYSLGMPTRPFNPPAHLEGYKNLINIVKLKTYTELLEFSDENKEFLDVLKIQKYIGSNKNIQSRIVPSSKRALKLLEKSLHIFKDVYNIQKVTKSQDLNQMSDTTRLIGAVCINLAQFRLKYYSEKSDMIKNYYVEALIYYTIMHNMEKEKIPDQYTIPSNISVKYIYWTLYSLLSCKTINLDPIQEEKLANKQAIFRNAFPSKKSQKVKYRCEPRIKMRKKTPSKTPKKFQNEFCGDSLDL